MALIRFSPDKFLSLEFSLSVALQVLNEDDLTDSRGVIGIDKQQELGFILSAELHNVIEEGKRLVTKERQSVMFSAETYFGNFFVEAVALDGRITIFIDTYENRVATFRAIANELTDIQAAYAN